jgi:tripartite-type tricarboxylate transporter receptor subunit TctC
MQGSSHNQEEETMRRLPVLAAGALFAGLAPAAWAQDYPSRPIRIIVPAVSGGSNDVLARVIGDKLRERYGQPVLAENRPGASQMLGSELTAKSAPDGYTLMLPTATFASSVAMRAKLSFDPLTDLTGVSMVGVGPFMLAVHPSVPAKTVKELIALAKARSGQLDYGSAGTGSIIHLAAEVFAAQTHVQLGHVPYKSGAPAVTAAVAGEVPMIFMSLPSVWAQVKNNRLRAIAVTTAKRSTFVPDLPTVAESGVPGYEASQWWGILAPGKMNRDNIAKLNAEINRILGLDEIKVRLSHEGAEPVLMTPEAFTAFVHGEIAKWRKVVKERNLPQS